MEDEKYYAQLEKIFNPKILKKNLIVPSLFITAYEMLQKSIINNLIYFFANSWSVEKGWLTNERYKSNVLSLDPKDKDRSLQASLEWLKKEKVITQSEHDLFEKIKKCRNYLAHELPSFVTGEQKYDPLELFSQLLDLYSKIQKWFFINVNMQVDPDFDNVEIDEDSILPGPELVLRIIKEVALCNEDDLKNETE